MHEIFEVARRNAPCVLFIDEVDALGMRRANTRGGSGLRTVVDALLAEMDPATSDNTDVYVLGATNAPWDVDPALRRPGRFDRVILVGLPDSEARAEIVRVHLREASGGRDGTRSRSRRVPTASPGRTPPTSVTRRHSWRWRTRRAQVRSVRFRWTTSTRPWIRFGRVPVSGSTSPATLSSSATVTARTTSWRSTCAAGGFDDPRPGDQQRRKRDHTGLQLYGRPELPAR